MEPLAPAEYADARPWIERPANRPFDRVETLVAGVLVVAATAPGMLLLGASDSSTAPENPIFRLYWAPIYAATLVMSLIHIRAMARIWPAVLLTGALVVWAFLSQMWSILPDITQRRAVALLMTSLIGLYLGAAIAPERLVKMLSVGFAILAVGSAVVAVTIPRFGIEREVTLAGDWRGLWVTKNTLAEFMMMGTLAGVSAALLSKGRRWLWLGLALVCLALLLMSKGKTSLLCLFVALAVLTALAMARRNALWAVATAFAAGTVAIWGGFFAFVSPDTILKALGKDPTLTGRTDIWAAIMRQKPDDPALGFGFGAFWEKESTPAQVIRQQTHWLVPSAHNGWLDLLVQVGWFGMALFGLVLGITLVRILWRVYRLQDGYFLICFLVVFLMLSLSESVLEQHNNLPWSLFVAVLAYAFRPLSEPKAAPSSLPLRPRASAIDTRA